MIAILWFAALTAAQYPLRKRRMQGVYRLAGYDAYGFFRHGDTDLYVSAGASGWSFPFRTEAGCHYEVITLEQLNQPIYAFDSLIQ